MNIKRRHFEMACFASIAVLLGACSSTPDVKSQESTAVAKTATSVVRAATTVAKPTTIDQAFEIMTPPVSVAKKIKPVTKTRVVARNIKPAVVSAKPVRKVIAKRVQPRVAKPNYIPPKPIVVAIHNKPAQAKQRAYQVQQRKVQRPQPVVVAQADLRRPSLPRASAAMVAGAPVIRPATVPRSNQPLSRAQWQKQQQALAYRTKWEKEQQLKAQQAKVRQQQIRQQQARAQQVRVQQARVQQASYQPQVSNAVLQRPQINYAQSRLTGDFAGNPRAKAFIRMMESKHGFDSAYVAGVLSRAKATSWLRKQAYKDANPVKRTKKSKGPSWSNYRRRFITSKHINTGTAFYNRYKGSLQRAEAQYGVPSEYILGIMGVETIYGGNVGTDKAIDALSTMGFMNSRRGKYFTSELESYFLMTRRARLDPLQPKASWAGALGLPQFMPSNIKKYGVDYDGDGAVNLWTPHDAIGSVANYLRSHGWKPGEIAAIPAVKVGGSGYSRLKNGFKYKYSLSKLARNGLKPAYPGVSGMVNMVKLRVSRGNEYWVGGNNFYVITRYNHSSHYAMAVHQLAQEIRKRVKPGNNNMRRVINASSDKNLLMQAANRLL